MKKFTKFLAAVLVLLSISLNAQTIGSYSLVNMAAPVVTRSIAATGFSAGFLEAIGGVAFEKKAVPAQGFDPHSIVLQYVSQNPDGARVVATIDGQPVRVNLYDWQLAPIVKFAQTDDHAVFTLFGKLDDPEQEKKIKENGGEIVNYHQAFTMSLMGLRMLQLDNLLAGSANDDLAVEMPKNGNRYLLGTGEHGPDVAANRAALKRFTAALKTGGIVRAGRSYVVGDHGRDVQFDIDDGTLRISGEPGYYFWEYNGDAVARKQIRQAKSAARTARGAAFDEQDWLIDQLKAELERLGKPLRSDEEFSLLLADATELEGLLGELKASELEKQPAYKQVVQLNKMSDFVSSHLGMVRSINPTVWDAAVTVMRYSAFFRYCKEADAASWQNFASSVRRIAVLPAVSTPTVLQLTATVRETASRVPQQR